MSGTQRMSTQEYRKMLASSGASAPAASSDSSGPGVRGTERMCAKAYLKLVNGRKLGAAPKRTNKFGNQVSVDEAGQKYDSNKERRHHQALLASFSAADPATRVVQIERQVKFELVPKQDGERAVNYFADFVVTYADAHVEVHDVKSFATRKDKAYVIKRKMMLLTHGIRIIEI